MDYWHSNLCWHLWWGVRCTCVLRHEGVASQVGRVCRPSKCIPPGPALPEKQPLGGRLGATPGRDMAGMCWPAGCPSHCIPAGWAACGVPHTAFSDSAGPAGGCPGGIVTRVLCSPNIAPPLCSCATDVDYTGAVTNLGCSRVLFKRL